MRRISLIIASILALVLCATCFAACNKKDNAPSLSEAEREISAAAAEATELEFLYVADTHFMDVDEVGDYTYQSFIARESTAQKMNHISEALFKQFCDEVIASGVKLLLIGGDINETGSYDGHVKIVAELDRLRAAGVTVYVVPGNHDTHQVEYAYTAEGRVLERNTTNGEFATLYANYGYTGTNRIESDNTKVDSVGMLSYTVDLNDKYTLVALDNISIKEDLPESVITWLTNQITSTISAGKTPLLLMHAPLEEIFTGVTRLANLRVSGSFVENQNALTKKLYNAGLRYVFTGHMHSNDLMIQDTNLEDDNPGILQFMNTTISGYDASYHKVRFTQNYVDFSPRYVSAPKESYLPSYLTQEDKTAILTDWSKYLLNFTNEDFLNKVYSIVPKINGVLSSYVLGVEYDDMDATQKQQIDGFCSDLFGYLDYPIYAKDKASGETSLEDLLKKYGWTGSIPVSDYKTNADVIIDIITRCFTAGDKEISKDGAEWQMVKLVIYGLVAQLVECDLFGLMEDFGLEVQNVDCTQMITRLLNEGVLDLSTYLTLDNILEIAYLQGDGTIQNMLNALSDGKFKSAMYGLLGTVKNLLKLDLTSYFIIDQAATDAARAGKPDSTKTIITGEILLDDLLDDFVFDVIGDGLFYDSLCKTQNVVFNRVTGKAYDK